MIDLPCESEPVKVVEGDCLPVLRSLASGSVHAVITDPPYGIGEARGKNRSRSCLATSQDYGVSEWDDKPCSPECIEEMRRVSRLQIIFGGNYFNLPPSSCWLVWDKLNGNNDFADCELAWTNMPRAVRRITHQWHGMIREGQEERFHPTQKPLRVMRWAIRQLRLPKGSLILDPFGGSGTTAVAAVCEGHRCLTIEREPAYCDIIHRRVQEAMGTGLLAGIA